MAKLSEIKDRIYADTLSKKDDIYTARKQFFYTHGYTSAKFAENIKLALPHAIILEHRERWRAFRGGASVGNSSHWEVKFKIQADNEDNSSNPFVVAGFK